MKKILLFVAVVCVLCACETTNKPDNGGRGVYNNHEYVDLGLPSGVKWGTCNVGAGSATETGDYFAWGETKPKSDYSWMTYSLCADSLEMTKYCVGEKCGKQDGKSQLDKSDDVAHVVWGGKWRMPTVAEQKELMDNCIITYVYEYEGKEVCGFILRSKINYNAIFVPMTGRYEGTELTGQIWMSMLASSSVSGGYSESTPILLFLNGDKPSAEPTIQTGYASRTNGVTVRPVYK